MKPTYEFKVGIDDDGKIVVVLGGISHVMPGRIAQYLGEAITNVVTRKCGETVFATTAPLDDPGLNLHRVN